MKIAHPISTASTLFLSACFYASPQEAFCEEPDFISASPPVTSVNPAIQTDTTVSKSPFFRQPSSFSVHPKNSDESALGGFTLTHSPITPVWNVIRQLTMDAFVYAESSDNNDTFRIEISNTLQFIGYFTIDYFHEHTSHMETQQVGNFYQTDSISSEDDIKSYQHTFSETTFTFYPTPNFEFGVQKSSDNQLTYSIYYSPTSQTNLTYNYSKDQFFEQVAREWSIEKRFHQGNRLALNLFEVDNVFDLMLHLEIDEVEKLFGLDVEISADVDLSTFGQRTLEVNFSKVL